MTGDKTNPAPMSGDNTVIEFGHGKFVVDTGTHDGKPAVFIAKANQPGVPGDSAAREGFALDRLQPGELVLIVQSEEAAQTICDIFCGAHP